MDRDRTYAWSVILVAGTVLGACAKGLKIPGITSGKGGAGDNSPPVDLGIVPKDLLDLIASHPLALAAPGVCPPDLDPHLCANWLGVRDGTVGLVPMLQRADFAIEDVTPEGAFRIAVYPDCASLDGAAEADDLDKQGIPPAVEVAATPHLPEEAPPEHVAPEIVEEPLAAEAMADVAPPIDPNAPEPEESSPAQDQPEAETAEAAAEAAPDPNRQDEVQPVEEPLVEAVMPEQPAPAAVAPNAACKRYVAPSAEPGKAVRLITADDPSQASWRAVINLESGVRFVSTYACGTASCDAALEIGESGWLVSADATAGNGLMLAGAGAPIDVQLTPAWADPKRAADPWSASIGKVVKVKSLGNLKLRAVGGTTLARFYSGSELDAAQALPLLEGKPRSDGTMHLAIGASFVEGNLHSPQYVGEFSLDSPCQAAAMIAIDTTVSPLILANIGKLEPLLRLSNSKTRRMRIQERPQVIKDVAAAAAPILAKLSTAHTAEEWQAITSRTLHAMVREMLSTTDLEHVLGAQLAREMCNGLPFATSPRHALANITMARGISPTCLQEIRNRTLESTVPDTGTCRLLEEEILRMSEPPASTTAAPSRAAKGKQSKVVSTPDKGGALCPKRGDSAMQNLLELLGCVAPEYALKAKGSGDVEVLSRDSAPDRAKTWTGVSKDGAVLTCPAQEAVVGMCHATTPGACNGKDMEILCARSGSGPIAAYSKARDLTFWQAPELKSGMKTCPENHIMIGFCADGDKGCRLRGANGGSDAAWMVLGCARVGSTYAIDYDDCSTRSVSLETGAGERIEAVRSNEVAIGFALDAKGAKAVQFCRLAYDEEIEEAHIAERVGWAGASKPGALVACSSGGFVSGACSGSKRSCIEGRNEVLCSEVQSSVAVASPKYLVTSSPSENVECPDRHLVSGICSSASGRTDCEVSGVGKGRQALQCVAPKRGFIVLNSGCLELSSNDPGARMTIQKDDYAMVGYCASDKAPECGPKKTWQWSRYCPIKKR
jgi:hypothetical protein